MVNLVAWHGRTSSDHQAMRDTYLAQGFRFESLSIYGPVDAPVYAAVVRLRPELPPQLDWPCLDSAELQDVLDAQSALGRNPVMLAATGTSDDPRFALVVAPDAPVSSALFGLRSGSPADPTTLQGLNSQARSSGRYLHWAAAYGEPGDESYAAIWRPNPDVSLWNADGLADTGAEYQARFDAEQSAWCRPRFVTVGSGARYLSVFTDREIGAWVARHGMTPQQYQHEFDSNVAAGFYPTCVQAAGPSAGDATFAALFDRSDTTTVARTFTATGPVENAAIDAVVRDAVENSPVKHAALAITYGTKLLYARGYSNVEPDWPLATPTTRFRMASVSKVVTAIAVRQLLASGDLTTDTRLQDVLHLTTPSGTPPTDTRFGDITIAHLLEHTSGLVGQAATWGDAVQKSFQQAGQQIALPVTEDQTNAYVASLMLESDPGAVTAYNNCAYALLGSVVRARRGAASPIAAFAEHVFSPAGLTRMGSAVSLVADSPADEARYQAPSLALSQSDMSDDRPLVPLQYGDEQLETMTGSGGLSGAVVDQARMLTALVTGEDTVILARDSVIALLDDAATRGGYGFDSVESLGNGRYRAQKGGSLQSSNNVLSFDDQWGLVMAWASPPLAADASWYPWFPQVMDIAKTALDTDVDLFESEYGFAPL